MWVKTVSEEWHKLAGMQYHGGKYGPEYWLGITGVDPRNYPHYVSIRGGFCYWTAQARRKYGEHCLNRRNNFALLGVK